MVGSEWFLDLLYNHGRQVALEPLLMCIRMEAMDPREYVIGMRMNAEQLGILEANRWNYDSEAYARMGVDRLKLSMGIKPL